MIDKETTIQIKQALDDLAPGEVLNLSWIEIERLTDGIRVTHLDTGKVETWRAETTPRTRG